MISCFGRFCLTLVLFAAVPLAARADLIDYVRKPEPGFAWKFKGKTDIPGGTVFDLELKSQVWQEIPWEHHLQVFRPANSAPSSSMLLWNQGGKSSPTSALFGMALAKQVGAPVAFLFGIPNQPLFDGKKEDSLIAETFVRYLETRDEDWPLLFPMVKSLVKAMDALEAFSKTPDWGTPVKGFVVSGASKRGWTTWLTAVADPRVRAIAPLVIDTLNFRAQMPHQLACFGKYSEQIRDYTERGLVPMPDTAEAKRLWTFVDPWHYRERLKMPKLIINGANDPYWTTDALNLYWNDLTGDKWVLYVPNAGHNLQQKHANGKTDRDRAINGLTAFARLQMEGTAPPRLEWKHEDADGKLRLTVTATRAPASARLWVAHAPTRDFRAAEWKETAATVRDSQAVGEVAPPKEGYVAFFGEMEFENGGGRYPLSTQMRVAGGK